MQNENYILCDETTNTVLGTIHVVSDLAEVLSISNKSKVIEINFNDLRYYKNENRLFLIAADKVQNEFETEKYKSIVDKLAVIEKLLAGQKATKHESASSSFSKPIIVVPTEQPAPVKKPKLKLNLFFLAEKFMRK